MDYPATQMLPCSDDEDQEDNVGSPEKTAIQIGKLFVNSVAHPVYRGINRIGRLDHCHIVINDDKISKEHAEIEADTGSKSTFVCDLGSMNKTRLNNILLKPRKMYQLNYGDILRFGDVTAMYCKINEAVENGNHAVDPSKRRTESDDAFVVPDTPARLSKDLALSTICIPSSPDISFDSDRSSVGSCNNSSLVAGTQQDDRARKFGLTSVENKNNEKNSGSKENEDDDISEAETQITRRMDTTDEDNIFDAETQRPDVPEDNILEAETQRPDVPEDVEIPRSKLVDKTKRTDIHEEPTQLVDIYEAPTQVSSIHDMETQRFDIPNEPTRLANIHEHGTQIIDNDASISIGDNNTAAINVGGLIPSKNTVAADQEAKKAPKIQCDGKVDDSGSETDEEGTFTQRVNDDFVVRVASASRVSITDSIHDAPTQLIGECPNREASSGGQDANKVDSKKPTKSSVNEDVKKAVSSSFIIDDSCDEDDDTDFDESPLDIVRASPQQSSTPPKLAPLPRCRGSDDEEIVVPSKIVDEDCGKTSPCLIEDAPAVGEEEQHREGNKPNDSIELRMDDLFDGAKNDSFVDEPTQMLTQTLHKVLEVSEIGESTSPKSSPEKKAPLTPKKNSKSRANQVEPWTPLRIMESQDIFRDLPEVTIFGTESHPGPLKRRGRPKKNPVSDEDDSDAEEKPTTPKRKVVKGAKTKRRGDVVLNSVADEVESSKDDKDDVPGRSPSKRISKSESIRKSETATKNTTLKQTTIERTPLEQTPIKEYSIKGTSKKQTPIKNNQIDQTSNKKSPANETPVKQTRQTPNKQTRQTPIRETRTRQNSLQESDNKNVPNSKNTSRKISRARNSKKKMSKSPEAPTPAPEVVVANVSEARVGTRTRKIISYATVTKDQLENEKQTAESSRKRKSAKVECTPASAPSIEKKAEETSTSDTNVTATKRTRLARTKTPERVDVTIADESPRNVPVQRNDVAAVTVRTNVSRAVGTRRKVDKVTVRRGPSSPMVRVDYDKPASPTTVPSAQGVSGPIRGRSSSIDLTTAAEETIGGRASRRRKTTTGADVEVVSGRKVKTTDSNSIGKNELPIGSPVAVISLKKVKAKLLTKTPETKVGKGARGRPLKNSKIDSYLKMETSDTPEKPTTPVHEIDGQTRGSKKHATAPKMLMERERRVDPNPSLESQEIESIFSDNKASACIVTPRPSIGNRFSSRRIPSQKFDQETDDSAQEADSTAMVDLDETGRGGRRGRKVTKDENEEKKTPVKRGRVVESTPAVAAIALPKVTRDEVDAKRGKSGQANVLVEKTTPEENIRHKVLFTGISDNRLTAAVKALGGSVTEKPRTCTVLVTDKVRRTFKFLCAIGAGVPIVSDKWLSDSQTRKRFLPTDDYILKDRVAEANYNFKLKNSLVAAAQKPLLAGWTVVLAPNATPPPLTEMKEIVQACGGKPLVRAPAACPKNTVIVGKDDPAVLKKFINPAKLAAPVVNMEFILTGVLRQELDFKDYRIHL